MLMAELSTAVALKLPVKIILLKNNSMAEVQFEQAYGCDLPPIDFVAFAQTCGADAFRCETQDQIRPAIDAALKSPKPAVVEAIVDAREKPAKPEQLRE